MCLRSFRQPHRARRTGVRRADVPVSYTHLDVYKRQVLPSSVLTFESYFKLRNEVKEKLDLKLLGKLGNFVFEDALTDVSIFVGKRPQSRTYPKIIWTKNEKGVVPEAVSYTHLDVYKRQVESPALGPEFCGARSCSNYRAFLNYHGNHIHGAIDQEIWRDPVREKVVPEGVFAEFVNHFLDGIVAVPRRMQGFAESVRIRGVRCNEVDFLIFVEARKPGGNGMFFH